MDFSPEYTEYVLDPNAHLEVVNAEQCQDPYLNQYVEMQPVLQQKWPETIYGHSAHQGQSTCHATCSANKLDFLAENSVKDTTKRQTVWGVNVLRGKKHKNH